MANEEIKTFNVKNTSVRLVHIGGVTVMPEQVVALIDDEAGVNRAGVDESEYLEETDEEVTGTDAPFQPKASAQKAAMKKASKPAAAPTATGAGWNAGDKK